MIVVCVNELCLYCISVIANQADEAALHHLNQLKPTVANRGTNDSNKKLY